MIQLNNVTYAYKTKYQTVYAVDSVSVEFNQGVFYAITGKSGSGKTTLLSLISGLDFPIHGEVLYNNTPTTKLELDEYRRDHVSMIYQNYNLFPLLTVYENVMYPLELKKIKAGEAKIIAEQKLMKVGLDERYWRRFPHMLSGGEQQRVAIARALASEPAYILADEPTGNLDGENSINIIELFRESVNRDNICVIIVTHDQSISEMADVIYRMEDGKLII